MEEKKWFSLKNNKVQGPMTPSEVNAKISSGDLIDALFWSRGRKGWFTRENFNSEVTKDEELIKKALIDQSSRYWKVKDGEEELKAMPYEEMLDLLKSKKNYSNIKLWTEGYQEWRNIYDLPNILDELGVSRRQHPRIPITGSFVIELQSGVWEAQLTTISEGGCGLSKCFKILIGDRFKGFIHSPQLPIVIHCTAEVVFINSSGQAGLKFINISTESKNQIIAYIKTYLDKQNLAYEGIPTNTSGGTAS